MDPLQLWFQWPSKVCPTCGVPFPKRGKEKNRFCSRACYQDSRRPRNGQIKTCLACQSEFYAEPRTADRRRYCSNRCRRTGHLVPCAICGKEFYVKQADLGAAKYCSRPCQYKGQVIDGPGSRCRVKSGYVKVHYPKHPDAAKNGTIFEHRLVAEEKIGRRLLKTEHVRHINGIKDDNRPENLEVLSARAHHRITNVQEAQKRKKEKAELEEYRKRFGPLKD